MYFDDFLVSRINAVYFFAFIFLLLILFIFLIYLTSSQYPNLNRHESEKYFINPKGGKPMLFPSLFDKDSLDLSIIVPAYNEEERLPKMLDETMDYIHQRLENNPKFTFEIIIVNDGSKDQTTKIAHEYSSKHGVDKIRVLCLEQNRGKGGAVRIGVLSARGRLILFVDADGATKFSDLDSLEEQMKKLTEERKETNAVVVGSRAHMEAESVVQRSLFRTVLMRGFHLIVWFLCVRDVKDTQCGFKLFTRPAARQLFSNLHVERWAFDVDLLYLASYFKIPIAEVPVTWEEIEGSKIIPVFSWLQMGKDLLLIRLRYCIGAWKIQAIDTKKAI